MVAERQKRKSTQKQKKRKARTISPHWFPLVAQRVKRLLALWETWVRSPDQEEPLEKEMATHSITLAWKIPWMEKPGRLQSTGCKESDTTERLHFLSLYG